MTACAHDATPILLLSNLAEHTMNLQADPRGSLLFDGTYGLDSPLTGVRVTVLGTLAKSDDSTVRARYRARHPEAAGFIEFPDFNLYRLTVERAHIVAGFGAIDWLNGAEVRFDSAGYEALAGCEEDIVAHMNHDHADALGVCAKSLLGLGGNDWRMTGVDPEGIDLRDGGRVA